MQAALNSQMRLEFESAYVYLAMASYCEANQMDGSAHWLKAQSREEMDHAMKFYDHLHARGGEVKLQALPEPASDFNGVLDVFERALAHEKKVTAAIHALYFQANQEKDYASLPLLQEFIAEQVEEEKTATDIVARLKMAGHDVQTLMLLDRELGSR
jgi:ferritin